MRKTIPWILAALIGCGESSQNAAAPAAPAPSLSTQRIQVIDRRNDGMAPAAIAAADFNGDGRLDIAACSVASGSAIDVYLADETGRFPFVAPNEVHLTQDATGMVAGDFDADARADLLVAARTGELMFLQGLGTGEFAPARLLPCTLRISSMAVLDSDGRCSAVVSNGLTTLLFSEGLWNVQPFDAGGRLAARGNEFAILDNTGDPAVLLYRDGQFVASYALPEGHLGTDVLLVDSDIIVSTINDETEADGLVRVFHAGAITDLPASSPVRRLCAGDFNGDGRIDLVHADDGGLAVEWNNGDGSYTRGADRLETTEVAALASDGSGLFLASDAFYYLPGGPALFRHAESFPISPMQVVFADVDGDGRIDLVAGSDGTIAILPGDGTGALGAARTSALPEGSLRKLRAAGPNLVAQIDESVYLGTDGGTQWTRLGWGEDPQAADIDGDGILEIVAVDPTSGSPRVLGRDADGSAPGIFRWNELALVDLDGDGDLDAVIRSEDPAEIASFRNVAGAFQEVLRRGLALDSYAMLAGDFDGSGRGEVMLVSRTEPQATKILRQFELLASALRLEFSPSLAMDLDGDGRLDLAGTIPTGTGTLLLARGLGDGEWDRAEGIVVHPWAGAVAAADLNGDGRAEVAVGADWSNSIFESSSLSLVRIP